MDGRPTLSNLADVKESLLRHAPDKGRSQRLRIITRHPNRYEKFGVPGWSIDVAWCTPRPGQGRLAHSADALIEDLTENTTKATACIIDVLDVMGPKVDDVARWLITLDDVSAELDVDLYILVDEAMHSPHDVSRWSSIIPQARIHDDQPTKVETKDIEAPKTETTPAVDVDEIDGGQLRHLTKLPAGFSADALRRRILQWRRMGFDVSDLESALVHIGDKRERMYRHVEERVRRAVDLDRLLTLHADQFHATEIEHHRFRLRQLTGLDDIESKLTNGPA